MTFQVGDRVVVESESTQRRPRAGTVREIVREQPPRYRVEWDDGHESIYTPPPARCTQNATMRAPRSWT